MLDFVFGIALGWILGFGCGNEHKYMRGAANDTLNDITAPSDKWAVIDTDNFGRDYPDEKFVCDTENGVTEQEAKRLAALENEGRGSLSARYAMVVELPYELSGPFEG